MHDYFGFVYVWYDRIRKRLYIGSHYGQVDDGYICSSKWMKRVYQRRPSTFMRRILYWQRTDDKQEILAHEQLWLDLIDYEELGNRFYNLSKRACRGMFGRKIKGPPPQHVRDKISAAQKGRKKTPEQIEKMAASKRGKPSWNKGVAMKEETKRKLSLVFKGQKRDPELVAKSAAGIRGRKRVFTEEWKANMSKSSRGRIKSEETRKLLSEKIRATRAKYQKEWLKKNRTISP